MFEAMPLNGCTTLRLKNVCRKRSYAPTLALTQVKWGQKVSIGAQPTFFGIDLRIMWTELKMDRSVSDEVSFEEVFIVLWCMKTLYNFLTLA